MLNIALASALAIVDSWPKVVALAVEHGLLIIWVNLKPFNALYYYTSFSNELIDQFCNTFSPSILLNSLYCKLSSIRLIILLN